MKCPFCDTEINGISGLQEIKAFMEHLNSRTGCKKNPKRDVFVNLGNKSKKIIHIEPTDMAEALEIRAKSRQ